MISLIAVDKQLPHNQRRRVLKNILGAHNFSFIRPILIFSLLEMHRKLYLQRQETDK